MKMLKPGKVEMRKFVCDCCGCEFVAAPADVCWIDQEVECPQDGCSELLDWEFGEPYEEPTQDADTIERLADLIYDGCTTDGETAWEIAKHLTENGVTFREDSV